MLRHIDAYTSAGLILAGVVQTAPQVGAPAGKIDELWIIGTGLAIAFLGLLNLIRISAKLSVVSVLCTIAIVIGSLYLLNVARMVPSLNVLLVLGLALATTLCSLVPQEHARTKV